MRWFGRNDRDYQEEIREHIELEVQPNIDRGMPADEARRAAHATFGGMTKVRQQLHEGRRRYWLTSLGEDVRYGWRMIRRNARLSVLVIGILAIGIGFTTGVFSLVSAIAFSPPVRNNPDSFVRFVSDEGDQFSPQVATVPRYQALRQQARSMRELAAWSMIPFYGTLGSSDATRVQSRLVSCNFFSVFDNAPPLLGRFLQASDCDSPQPVMVISDDLWRSRFSQDPGIIGQTVLFADQPLTIVGVAKKPQMNGENTWDIWVPYTYIPLHSASPFPHENLMTTRNFDWMAMGGRLQPGYSRKAAAAEFRVLTDREESADPESKMRLVLVDGSLWSLAGLETLWMFSVALSLPTITLVLICATVATLLLSRSVGRQREMAIRLALGSGRSRLVRMLLVESLLLAGMAAVASLLIVYKVPGMLLTFFATGRTEAILVQPDWKVFTYLGVLTLFTAVCSGVSPALESLNLRLVESLKGRSGVLSYRGPARLRTLLVVVQISLCMIPLVGAAAMIRAGWRLNNPGFETRQVLVAELPRKVNAAETQSSLAQRIRTLPNIRSVAYTGSLPAIFEGSAVFPEASSEPVLSTHVSFDYFDVLSIPLLSGRSFEEIDRSPADGIHPVVVSQQFAARFFGSQDPVGKVLRSSVDQKQFRIIGIARNRSTARGAFRVVNDGAFVYQLMEPSLTGYLLVRFDGDPAALAPQLRLALKDATTKLVAASTLRSLLDESTVGMARLRSLMLILGAAVLVLALAGVFGLLSYNVAQRKKEVAIRMALGADRTEIIRSIATMGLRPIPLGILAGLLLSFAGLKAAESTVLAPLALRPNDPIPYFTIALFLIFATFAATFLPAYRAARSNPASALRDE